MEFKVKMVLDRSTPAGTHLYKAPNQKSATIRNVYITKNGFEGNPPREIEVTIKYDGQ